ncbi:MAG: SCO family protein [Gammaproteobacteria bacterium]
MPRILVAALVLLAGATVWVSSIRQNLPAPAVATLLPEPLSLPAVQLTDQHGLDFSTRELEGAFSLMFFGFTHCPDICPITLQTLANVDAQLRAKGLDTPRVVFVSVDPDRDTPAQIERYLENFNSGFVGITGTQRALQPLIAALGVTVQRQEFPGETAYNVTHNSTVYLIGPQAELVALFSAPHDAAVIATDYLRIRRLYQTQRTAASASL